MLNVSLRTHLGLVRLLQSGPERTPIWPERSGPVCNQVWAKIVVRFGWPGMETGRFGLLPLHSGPVSIPTSPSSGSNPDRRGEGRATVRGGGERRCAMRRRIDGLAGDPLALPFVLLFPPSARVLGSWLPLHHSSAFGSFPSHRFLCAFDVSFCV
jgi:hypothetical protein